MTPKNSALVLIRPQTKIIKDIGSTCAVDVMSALARLTKDAADLEIPTLVFIENDKKAFGSVDAAICDAAGEQAVHPSSTAQPWEDEAFVAKVKLFGRRQIVLGGFETEGAVSFAALSALVDGFAIHVLADGCAGASAINHNAALSRLTQSGAVQVTTRSISLEWGVAGASDMSSTS